MRRIVVHKTGMRNWDRVFQGKERGWLRGGTRTEEAAAARAWMTGWVTEELKPESQPGDPTRSHSGIGREGS